MADMSPHLPTTFGGLLRHLRQRARLTQDELGIAVGYSRAHVARLESNQRTPDVAAVRARFPEALKVQDGSETMQRLVELAIAARKAAQTDNSPQPLAEAERPEPSKPIPNNLPAPLTSFIGRTQELRELDRLLPTTRLLTLTGAGGAGKTRLALALAADAKQAYADGVWLAELASLSDSAALPQVVLGVLGLHEEPNRPALTTLLDALRGKQMLMVLDNCEHLIEACAQLAEAVLRNSPAVRILATSREALGIGGELAWRVPSLQTPLPTAALALADLARYEAVQLFSARAVLAAPGFMLTAWNSPAVQQICTQLDGMPLAIELAAARVKVLSPQDIAARLNDRFHLLTGGSRTALPRHQTLRAMIDWSYQLLTEPERQTLRRLSVFVGGWTMEAAEAVCQGDEIAAHDVLDLLARLVDKSLVVMSEHDGVTRYHLLETIRQYAAERLEEAGEGVAVREGHLDYFLSLGERVEPQLSEFPSSDQVLTINRLARDLDNVRRALDWAVEFGQFDKGLRLILAMDMLFIVRSLQIEMLARLNAMIEHATAPRNTLTEAKAYLRLANLYMRQDEDELGAKLLKRAEAVVLTPENFSIQAEILSAWANYTSGQGNYDLALSYHKKWRELHLSNNLLGLSEEVYVGFEALGDGMLSFGLGNYDHAVKRLTFLHSLLVERGNKVASTAMSRTIGYALLYQGRIYEAGDWFYESLNGTFALGYTQAVAACLAACAAYALSQEDLHISACLFGASESIADLIHTPLRGWDVTQVQRNLATLRQQLDPAELAEHWAIGRAMTLEQAVDYALSYRSVGGAERSERF